MSAPAVTGEWMDRKCMGRNWVGWKVDGWRVEAVANVLINQSDFIFNQIYIFPSEQSADK